MATPDQDPRNLHDLAVDCRADLHKLAAGLVQAGVPPQQTDVINHMAQMVGTVAASLGQAGAGGAPEGAPAPAPEAPQAAPAGPAGAQPPTSPQQDAVHHGIHGAVQMLHGAMQASKQARGA